MQPLRDNLTLWTSSDAAESSEAQPAAGATDAPKAEEKPAEETEVKAEEPAPTES
jgi:hypothetical protein